MEQTINYQSYQRLANDSRSADDVILKKRSIFSSTGILSFLFLSIIFMLSYISLSYRSIPNSFNSRQSTTENDVQISLSVLNPDYPEGLKCTKSNMLPWPIVVEPYKNHVASINSLLIDSDEKSLENYDFEWNIGNQYFSGTSGTFLLTEVGNCTASIILTSKSTSNEMITQYQYNFYIVVKYVRREIRNMTDADRTTFLDALQILYEMNETTGKAIYGSKFHSMEYFLVMHLIGAGTTDCDHWHDGAGIITHHMAFTLAVEQSLQSINPAISMPYWEYGMDQVLYDVWTDVPVFNDDWFGEANPSSEDHTITKGRWKDTTLPIGTNFENWDIKNTGTLNPFVNAYGQLRSPWNNNPTPKLGRHNTTYGSTDTGYNPSCETFQFCYEYDTLSGMNYCLNGVLHGTVHIKIGGAWEKNTTTYNDSLSFTKGSYRVLLFKKLWRKGYVRCPSYCPNDGSSCKCFVPEEYKSKFTIEAMLEDVDAGCSYTSLEEWKLAMSFYEDPGIAGDMFTSAAPYDPTFWPLHGSMERLLDLKRIRYAQGNSSNTFNETWGFYNDGSGGALTGVCDWSQVNGPDDLTLPLCDSNASCTGHDADDLLEFGNFLNRGETYTNQQFYEFLHPWNLELPYTYDTFDYDYCIGTGYYFD